MPGNPNEWGRCHSGKRPKASVKLRFSGTTAEPSLDFSEKPSWDSMSSPQSECDLPDLSAPVIARAAAGPLRAGWKLHLTWRAPPRIRSPGQ